MAWSQIGGNTRYVKANECQKGDVAVEGWYEGAQAGKYQPTHFFRTAGGERVGINQTQQLKWIMDQVEVGEYLRVIYDGKDILKKTGNAAHHFSAMRDPSKKGQSPNWETTGGVEETEAPATPGEDDPLA